jgi:hypothetical protein
VWPSVAGKVRGIALMPLYPSVPSAALGNQALHESLTLFDGIRVGNARERSLARKFLEERL